MSRTSTRTPSRTQLQAPTTPRTEDGTPLCTGHNRRAARFTAGANTKNAGRAFFTCPLSRDDESRCKFFKWADEIESTPLKDTEWEPTTPAKGQVQDRLNSAAKRKREDDTPKAESNPFAPTTHPMVEPVISMAHQLSEHIARQDRLLAAADRQKDSLRQTIKSLQERNEELEKRVRELEGR